MIDFQSQMSFATMSIDAVLLRNNAALVAHAAAGFEVSTILTTVAEKTFSGPMNDPSARAGGDRLSTAFARCGATQATTMQDKGSHCRRGFSLSICYGFDSPRFVGRFRSREPASRPAR